MFNDIGGGTSEEVIRLIELINDQGCRWKPGIHQGDTVRVKLNLPISFRIDSDTQVHGDTIIEYSCCDSITVNLHENNLSNTGLEVYPNPATDILNLKLMSAIEFEGYLCLLNSVGKIVYDKKINLNSGANNFNIDINNMTSGVYFISIQDSNSTFIARKKILVMK